MEEEGCSQLFAFKHRSKLHHSEPQFLAYIEIVDYSDAICAGRSFCRISNSGIVPRKAKSFSFVDPPQT
jgi:hypothetical protein